jgi:hypothetical protein
MPMPVPGTWDEGSHGVLAGYNGPAWYRCLLRIPENWRGRGISLVLPLQPGRYEIWCNGKLRSRPDTRPAADALQGVTIISLGFPDGWLPGDVNLLVVRVTDGGSICRGLEGEAPALIADGRDAISLAGAWQFRIADDPSFATLPLPAKFAASTDVIFEPADSAD